MMIRDGTASGFQIEVALGILKKRNAKREMGAVQRTLGVAQLHVDPAGNEVLRKDFIRCSGKVHFPIP
jgi:hypothetical protein